MSKPKIIIPNREDIVRRRQKEVAKSNKLMETRRHISEEMSSSYRVYMARCETDATLSGFVLQLPPHLQQEWRRTPASVLGIIIDKSLTREEIFDEEPRDPENNKIVKEYLEVFTENLLDELDKRDKRVERNSGQYQGILSKLEKRIENLEAGKDTEEAVDIPSIPTPEPKKPVTQRIKSLVMSSSRGYTRKELVKGLKEHAWAIYPAVKHLLMEEILLSGPKRCCDVTGKMTETVLYNDKTLTSIMTNEF